MNGICTTLFESASPFKTERPWMTHKATQFQVESGETRSDHVVINPVEIGMDPILTGELKMTL